MDGIDSSGVPSRFAPSVEVFSSVPASPQPPALDLESVVERFPGFRGAEALCWTGSMAVGRGNPQSDLDFYAFADTEIDLPSDESVESWTSTVHGGTRVQCWMGRYGDRLADVQVWPTNFPEKLLEPFLGGKEPEFCGMSTSLQEVVFRLSVAVPLKNAAFFEDVRSLIARSSYKRALGRSLKSRAENLLVDVVGQLQADDFLAARYTAIQAATFAADHCLVLSGDLCRGPKWLLRRLSQAPDCGIQVGEFEDQVLRGPHEGESGGDTALRVARWAQSHLVRMEPYALATGGMLAPPTNL